MSVDMTKWQEIAKQNIHNRPAGQGRLAGKITIVTGAAQGFGKGIHQAANAFRKAGMTDVQVKLYPDCRHEILNELNKEEVFADVTNWIAEKI